MKEHTPDQMFNLMERMLIEIHLVFDAGIDESLPQGVIDCLLNVQTEALRLRGLLK